jgi:thioredoxin-like negative regulator of GroEL
MYPQIEKMRQAGYIIYVIDVDEYTKTRDHFEAKSVPTLVVMDKGKEVTRFTGVTDADKITKYLVKEADQKDDEPKPEPKPDNKYNFLP